MVKFLKQSGIFCKISKFSVKLIADREAIRFAAPRECKTFANLRECNKFRQFDEIFESKCKDFVKLTEKRGNAKQFTNLMNFYVTII